MWHHTWAQAALVGMSSLLVFLPECARQQDEFPVSSQVVISCFIWDCLSWHASF